MELRVLRAEPVERIETAQRFNSTLTVAR